MAEFAATLAAIGWPAAWAALCVTLLLAVKSLLAYSRTGPRISRVVLRRLGAYAGWAFVRLCAWGFLVSFYFALWGSLLATSWAMVMDRPLSPALATASAFLGLLSVIGVQFARRLVLLPSILAASASFDLGRFAWLAERLSAALMQRLHHVGVIAAASGVLGAITLLSLQGRSGSALTVLALLAALLALYLAANAAREPAPIGARRSDTAPARPSFLLIGSDSLRADRIHALRNGQPLMPNTRALALSGAHFANCFTPCARTAPALVSMLTGTLPPTHGTRENFLHPAQLPAARLAFPHRLAAAGYATAAIGDWAAADLGKFDLGFQQVTAAPDQWNLKYLIRQGPADLRLFLSLFTHNAFGRRMLPEIYYLAGTPLTTEVGREVRSQLARFARQGQPFCLAAFMATTHAPFGSEYPYYRLFADPAYLGRSRYVMADTSDLEAVIASQDSLAETFDLPQINALIDGCARRFDDEVGRTLSFLSDCGLADSTAVIVFSDHGFELFEAGSWGQGNSVIPDVDLRVPLVVKAPGRAPVGDVDAVVQLNDVAPTVCEMAGLPQAAGGCSLVPLLDGRPRAREDQLAYAETGIWLTGAPGAPNGHLRYPDIIDLLDLATDRSGALVVRSDMIERVIEAKDRMVRTPEWKLVFRPREDGAELLLFDLPNDPLCRRNVAALRPDIVMGLARSMQALADGCVRARLEAAVHRLVGARHVA